VPADLVPLVAGVVAAHHVPMLLHKQHTWARGVHGDMVNAMADLGIGVRNVLGLQSFVDRFPGGASVVGAEGTGSRDRDDDPSRIARIENDGVQAHPTGARLPHGTRAMATKSGEFVPTVPTVSGAEDGRVFHPRI